LGVGGGAEGVFEIHETKKKEKGVEVGGQEWGKEKKRIFPRILRRVKRGVLKFKRKRGMLKKTNNEEMDRGSRGTKKKIKDPSQISLGERGRLLWRCFQLRIWGKRRAGKKGV